MFRKLRSTRTSQAERVTSSAGEAPCCQRLIDVVARGIEALERDRTTPSRSEELGERCSAFVDAILEEVHRLGEGAGYELKSSCSS